jgi:hypothetical protein
MPFSPTHVASVFITCISAISFHTYHASLQLWIGLIVGACFLPSPEMVEAFPFGEWFEGARTAVSTAEIPGLNNGGLTIQELANPKLDPNLFVPVCKFSDSFYRTAKNAVYQLAGQETYQVRV